jgi:hypothetical protein
MSIYRMSYVEFSTTKTILLIISFNQFMLSRQNYKCNWILHLSFVLTSMRRADKTTNIIEFCICLLYSPAWGEQGVLYNSDQIQSLLMDTADATPLSAIAPRLCSSTSCSRRSPLQVAAGRYCCRLPPTPVTVAGRRCWPPLVLIYSWMTISPCAYLHW